MVNKVIILGGGSAGLLTALALKSKLPRLQVTVIRSKDIGIIGVGEGSTGLLTRFLHEYLLVNPAKFYSMVQPTWKLGLRFLWGPRPEFNFSLSLQQMIGSTPKLPRGKAYYLWDEMEYEDLVSALMTQNRAFARTKTGAPFFHANYAYHLENEKFVQFLEGFAVALGVTILNGTVTEIQQNEQGVSGLRLDSGSMETAGLYVDASGFASVLLGKTMGEPVVSFDKTLFCNRAVVGGWDRNDPDDMLIKPYTTCETMDSGWCWQIDHEDRVNRGYVYSSGFISDDQAEKEFRAKNPKVGPTRIVRFVSGRYRNTWVKNVVAVGNAGGFVEPLEATALGAISGVAVAITETLRECDGEVNARFRNEFNLYAARNWDDIRDFLSVHYRFNKRLDTPFWRHCWESTDLAGAQEVVDLYLECGPCFWMFRNIHSTSQFGVAGYLALLIGQKVEYQRRYRPSEDEMRIWNEERQRLKNIATHAMTVREVLAAIRAPSWQWKT